MAQSEKRKDSDSSVQKQLEGLFVTEYEKRTGFYGIHNTSKVYVVETFENEKDLQTALSNNKITERHLRGRFGPDDPVYVLEEDCSTIVNDTTLILEYTLKAE